MTSSSPDAWVPKGHEALLLYDYIVTGLVKRDAALHALERIEAQMETARAAHNGTINEKRKLQEQVQRLERVAQAALDTECDALQRVDGLLEQFETEHSRLVAEVALSAQRYERISELEAALTACRVELINLIGKQSADRLRSHIDTLLSKPESEGVAVDGSASAGATATPPVSTPAISPDPDARGWEARQEFDRANEWTPSSESRPAKRPT